MTEPRRLIGLPTDKKITINISYNYGLKDAPEPWAAQTIDVELSINNKVVASPHETCCKEYTYQGKIQWDTGKVNYASISVKYVKGDDSKQTNPPLSLFIRKGARVFVTI